MLNLGSSCRSTTRPGRSTTGEKPGTNLKEAWWVPEPVWAFWRKEKSLTPAWVLTPDPPTRSLVATPTTLTRYGLCRGGRGGNLLLLINISQWRRSVGPIV
jgi:hypothetical protein